MTKLSAANEVHVPRTLQAISPLSRRVYDTATMMQLIRYEQARADRSGQVFSLVTFAERDPQTTRAALPELMRFLCHRLRGLDEIGWLSGGRLAALLPYTTIAGANKVADDAIAALVDCEAPPVCEVFCYPMQWPDPPSTMDGGESRFDGHSHNARAMESLFVRPRPWWKRLLDIAGAVTGLVCLSPLLLTCTFLIRACSGGPVFFRQERLGLGGKPFHMFKFRTMIPQAETKRDALLALNEQDGPAFKMKKDPRVTYWGQWLRSTSIDELPQLWNVLRGEMSLVGPRPLPSKEALACEPWQRRRHDVPPGLTCIWQVHGRSSVAFDEWMRMDLKYAREQSIWKDIKLIFLTIPAVLLRRGAS